MRDSTVIALKDFENSDSFIKLWRRQLIPRARLKRGRRGAKEAVYVCERECESFRLCGDGGGGGGGGGSAVVVVWQNNKGKPDLTLFIQIIAW